MGTAFTITKVIEENERIVKVSQLILPTETFSFYHAAAFSE
jgi:hypothetical protein